MSKQKFAVFDIDGTLIRWQLYHAITDELGRKGYFSPKVIEQFHASRMNWKNRNNIDAYHEYEQVMVDAFQQTLAAIPVSGYMAAVDSVIDTYKDQVYTYTRERIKQLKASGYMLFAISGSPQEALDKLGAYYGFDDVVGPEYVRENGAFTGEIRLAHTRKGEILRELVQKHNVSWEGSVAVGDSPSDVAMLELVEQPIAFNPTDDLYKLAHKNGWPIVVERKNVVYELQRGISNMYELKEPPRG